MPVHGAVCFIEAEWKLFAKPFQHDGVWIAWAKNLAEMIAEPGPLSLVEVADLANRLTITLPQSRRKGKGGVPCDPPLLPPPAPYESRASL